MLSLVTLLPTILPYPLVLLAVRFILHYYVFCENERAYMEMTKGLVVSVVCGMKLLICVASRLVSITPDIRAEKEFTQLFLYIQLFSAFLEFRQAISLLGLTTGMFILASYAAATSEFWDTLLFWVAVFSVFRGTEPFVRKRFEDTTGGLVKRFYVLLYELEFAVLYLRTIEIMLTKPELMGSRMNLGACLVFMAFAYAANMLELSPIYHIFYRGPPTIGHAIVIIPEQVRTKQTHVYEQFRHQQQQLLLLGDTTTQSEQTDQGNPSSTSNDPNNQINGVDKVCD